MGGAETRAASKVVGRAQARLRGLRAAITSLLAVACLNAAAVSAARAEPAPPLESYGQLPALEMVTLSPSGQRMALVVHDDKGTKIYARQIGGPILMAAPVNDGFVDDVHWDGEDIVVVRISNIVEESGFSHMATGAFALDLASHKEIQVFGNAAEIFPEIGASFGDRDLQSRWYGFYGATHCPEQAPCAHTLYKVDLQTGRPLALDHSDAEPGWMDHIDAAPQWVVSAAGEPTGRLTYDMRDSRWTLVSTTSGKTLSEGDAGFDGVSVWGLGRDGQAAAFVTRGDDGFYSIFEAPLGGGASAALTRGQEVQGEWADPLDGHLVGYRWADDAWHDVMFDSAAQTRLDAARAAFPNNLVRLTSASRDFSRIIAFTDGGDDSGTYWLVDINSGKATVLGSAYPLAPPAATGRVSVFSYKAADGLPLNAVLTLPPGGDAKGLPLVVIVHGGPEERVRPGFDWLAQAFASRGYAVLAPNFRGSSGFGKAFRDAGFDQWGRKMQTDVSDGVDALAGAGVIDPKRVCIVGLDYGGYAAVAGVTLQHGLYRCAASYWGAFDLVDLFQNHSGSANLVATKYWSSFIGVGKPDANLGELSPVKRAAAADAPVLLVTTQPDRTMLIDEAPAMQQALRSAGKTVELTRIDSKDWLLRGATARIALLKAFVPFVETYNPAAADGTAAVKP